MLNTSLHAIPDPRHRRRQLARLAAVAAALGALIVTTGSLFAAPVTAAPASTTTVTLPLFGAPLTVDITTDAAGSLSSVNVTPADGLTATKLKADLVVFQNADGTATISVHNKRDRQTISARTGSLADISGPGQWKGDVFGTGTTTTVDFTVGDAGDGSPTISDVTSSDATAQIGAVQTSTDDGERSARVDVRFSDGPQSRTLTIKAAVSTEDGTTEATLKMSLGRTKDTPQPSVDVAGPHTWDGQLCDGTPAHIDFTVALDGTISGVTATPSPLSVKGGHRNMVVAFTKHQRVRISGQSEHGLTALSVVENFHCGGTPDTNVPVSEGSEDGGNSDSSGKPDDAGPQGDRGSSDNGDGHKGKGSDTGKSDHHKGGDQSNDHSGD